jgi:hypothetical protein
MNKKKTTTNKVVARTIITSSNPKPKKTFVKQKNTVEFNIDDMMLLEEKTLEINIASETLLDLCKQKRIEFIMRGKKK